MIAFLAVVALAGTYVDDRAFSIDGADEALLEAQVKSLIDASGIDARVVSFGAVPAEGMQAHLARVASERGLGNATGGRWLLVAYYSKPEGIRIETAGVRVRRDELTDLAASRLAPLLAAGSKGPALDLAVREGFRLSRRSFFGYWGSRALANAWQIVAGVVVGLLVIVFAAGFLASADADYTIEARRRGQAGLEARRRNRGLYILGRVLRFGRKS